MMKLINAETEEVVATGTPEQVAKKQVALDKVNEREREQRLAALGDENPEVAELRRRNEELRPLAAAGTLVGPDRDEWKEGARRLGELEADARAVPTYAIRVDYDTDEEAERYAEEVQTFVAAVRKALELDE